MQGTGGLSHTHTRALQGMIEREPENSGINKVYVAATAEVAAVAAVVVAAIQLEVAAGAAEAMPLVSLAALISTTQ